MIVFENLSKVFETGKSRLKALDKITLHIKRNESFGIIGESGAGKSTLLRMINGLEIPSSGKVIVKERDLAELKKQDIKYHRSQIGMIFQSYNLLHNKTVAKNIHLPLEIHQHPEALTVDEVLDFVGLADKKNAYPTELSGGQKQRVGIARALITKPKILLCDEPTSALDQSTTDDVVRVLERVNQEFNMTLVIVTHELEVIKHLCNRTAVLEDGKLLDVLEIETPDEEKGYDSYYERAKEVLKG